MDVATIASYCGCIITIGTLAFYTSKLIKAINKVNDTVVHTVPGIQNDIKEIKINLEKTKDELDFNSLETYKLVIMDEKIPLEERIKTGKRYLELGGNGGVKLKLKELEEKHALIEYKKLNHK